MKKQLLIISVALNLALAAQISTPVGEYQGGNSKDTGHYVDKPSMHVHEQTIVIDSNVHRKENKTGRSGAAVASDSGATFGNQGISNNEVGSHTSDTTETAGTTTPERNVEPVERFLVYGSIAALGLGILFGIYLIILLLQSKRTSRIVAILYGALIASGAAMLMVFGVQHRAPCIPISLILVGLTLGVGVMYLSSKNKQIPAWLAIIHEGFILTGFILLIVFACTL